jgi:hypothetical protein
MNPEIDGELNAFMDLSESIDTTEVSDDLVDQIRQEGALAHQLGGDRVTAEKLQTQIANFDPAGKTRRAPPPHVTENDRLGKATSFYLSWVSEKMATLNKSAEQVVSDWMEEFPNARPEIVSAIKEAARILDAA